MAPESLLGRRRECDLLDRLVTAVQSGHGAALVVRGEPGVGKTALLEYVVEAATEFRVARVVGVESELELPFAAIHQLCAPMLDRLPALPEPQRDALCTAFGLATGKAPDPFLVALAVLTLLCQAAEQKPVLCVIDDAQWVDRASAHVFAFVARRLLADAVALVFSTREASEDLAGLRELVLQGLRDGDAHTLLGSIRGAPLDRQVRDRIVAEAHGNPLALLEWHRWLTPAEVAGASTSPAALPLSGRIEEGFRQRMAQLPPATQQFLLVAAAEAVGDPALVWRAAEGLGIEVDAVSPAIEAGLVDLGSRVVFRHPLVRSAVYRAATLVERRDAHRALADATDPDVDPDRRTWHRAQAVSGPDEDVALELERSATRARARGGLAAAAAFLERSVALTVEPERRVERTLAAAGARLQFGGLEDALSLLALADASARNELDRAKVALFRGRMAFLAGDGSDALKLLLQAAKRFEPLDAGLARETYLEAINAACFAGSLLDGVDLKGVGLAAKTAPPSLQPARPSELLLDGLALLATEGPAAAAPTLRRAGSAFRNQESSAEEDLRWLRQACATASLLWDNESWFAMSSRWVQVARDSGALTLLSQSLNSMANIHLFGGDLRLSAALIAEAEAINDVTGSNLAPYCATYLAALRGRELEARALIEASTKEATAGGQGMVVAFAQWATATLYNGLARYDKALVAAQQASEHPLDWRSHLSLHELIEAAVRNGTPARGAAALERLSQTTTASGSNWAMAIEARSRALLNEGGTADALYLEALARIGPTGLATEVARTHLLYGEWLRRERRTLDARQQLRAAYEMFTTMGAEAFAERARIELKATGETVRKRVVETFADLTAQEAQVCHLAAEGATNAEIGARLFISASTVDYHLRKAFRKLGVNSRTQLESRMAQ